MKWFRFWTDTLDDVKILQLTDYEYRMWTYLLAFACESNSMSGECHSDVKSMSLRCRTQVNHFSKAIETFQKLGLVTINQDGFVEITNWSKRQFKSDNATERTRRYREVTSKRNVSRNVSGTAPDTDTDTDKERKKKERKQIAVSDKPKRAQLTDDAFLKALKENPAYRHINIDNELSKMDAWLMLPKARGRGKTRQFVVNWLNKIDKPMGGGNGRGLGLGGNRLPKEYQPEPMPEISDEERKRNLDKLKTLSFLGGKG